VAMRILVTTNAAIGHFLPMAPTVVELVARGHDVRIGCPESFASFVHRAGFAAMPCREEQIEASSTPSPPPAEDHDARLRWAVTSSWPSDCRTWVDSLVRAAERWTPDLVMVEPVEHAGRVLAAVLGTPLVVHGWGFTLPAGVQDEAAAAIADVYERRSATPVAPGLVTDLGPASVQAPDIGRARRYGYRPFSVPGEPIPPARTSTRRVMVTLGTYANAEAAPLIRAAARAALASGADVILVLGNEDRRSIEAIPDAATVLGWADIPAAMRTCDLVVHHGGAGTSWTGLSCGKPAVVLPLAGDQFRNAELLSAAGAAYVCTSHNHDDLVSAVATVMDEPVFTKRSAAIRRANLRLPSVAELARLISFPSQW
jgi:UDP:flavonoid glycosyltransferase YjiC (YdhE family)